MVKLNEQYQCYIVIYSKDIMTVRCNHNPANNLGYIARLHLKFLLHLQDFNNGTAKQCIY